MQPPNRENTSERRLHPALLTGQGSAGLICFGPFELNPATGELRKHGIKVRLQNKPIQLLEALLEKSGQVLTREELQRRLWGADTTVDFESGLNTAANRLRLALGDSAEKPLYIETLSRIGYRFVAPIQAQVEASHQTETALLDVAAPPEESTAALPLASPSSGGPKRGKWLWLAGTALTVAATGGIVVWLNAERTSPTFHQLTFRRLSIDTARFGPDGESVIYDGRERPGQRELYVTHPGSPESRSLGFPYAQLASVSRSVELALLTWEGSNSRRTLSRVPLNGGAPLLVDRDITGVDWTPDGSSMVVIPDNPAGATIECPRGKVLYKSTGWLSNVRCSPSGHAIAFLEHPMRGDDGGSVKVLESGGACRTLSDNWASAAGLAWSPSGKEVWFTATRSGLNRSLYAVSLAGRLRPVANFPGTLTLFDISRQGRVLIARNEERLAIHGTLRGETAEHDLSWFDYSRVTDMSDDGGTILFDESGEGGGPNYSAYIRRRGASSPMHIGDGCGMALSPDGQLAITMADKDPKHLNLVALSSAGRRVLSGHGLAYEWVRLFRDGKRLLAGALTADGKAQLVIQSLDGSTPRVLPGTNYVSNAAISPDGKWIAGPDRAGQNILIIPVDGGPVRRINLNFPALVSGWNAEGTSLFIANSNSVPSEVLQLDAKSGRSKLWKTLAPGDLTGVTSIGHVFVSRDEKSYAYSFTRLNSELFVVDGWH